MRQLTRIIALSIVSMSLSCSTLFYAPLTHAGTPLSGVSDSVDIIFIGDSWTAYAGQSGAPQGACVFPIFNPTFDGLPVGTCPYVPLFNYNCYGGCGQVTPDFTKGLSTEGLVRDRLNARGIPYSKVIKHENAVGSSKASDWAAGVPNDLSPANASGQFWPGVVADLQGKAKPIVWMTLGGNDIWPYGTVYSIDDTVGWGTARQTIQDNIDKVIQYLIAINPNVEIVMPSYTNFKINDGLVTTFPQVGTFGFCRQLWGADSNGSMFYATTYPDYIAAANVLAAQKAAVDVENYRVSYINANLWRVPWNISYAGLLIEAQAAANGQYSNAFGVRIGILSDVWTDPSVMISAFDRVTEQGLMPIIQILDTAWKNLAAAHPANLKYIPVWTTISTDPVQTTGSLKYKSPPRSEFADCIHLNPEGYNKWADRILNDWLPTSRYLQMR